MGKLDGKVAIVSGAARGMGAAHVKALAAEGAKVLAGDILQPDQPFLDDNIHFQTLDVTKSADWDAIVAEGEKRFGAVSILVNNAGVFASVTIDDCSEEEFRRVLDINLTGTFLGMKSVIGSMRQAGQGSIINISSTAGFAAHATFSAYVASKFAVRGLTKVAALEFAADNVRVNSIHPGAVRTPMTAGLDISKQNPIPRFAEPEEVSKMVLFLASDDASYSTGSEFVVDGGFTLLVGDVTH